MIHTKRLLLRAARHNDLEALHKIFADPETMRYWDSPPHSHDDTKRFLSGIMEADPARSLEYIVEREGQLIGRVGMWRLTEIGYIFDRAHWGKGYASEAVGALVQKIFARFPDISEITAEIDPRNTGSDHLLRKLGFRETGHAKNTFEINGEWSDSTYFALAHPQG